MVCSEEFACMFTARRIVLLGAVLVAALAGCRRTEPPQRREAPAPSASPPWAPAGSATVAANAPSAGAALFERFECARCHTALPAPPPEKQCVGCHDRIVHDRLDADPAVLRRWKKNIRHLTQVPVLTDLGARFRPEWLTEFFLEPQDLRPHLEETMPRFAMNRGEAASLAAWLTRDAPVQPAPATPTPTALAAERGREVYREKRCGQCHEFAGVMAGERSPLPPGADERFETARRLAPDLSVARERMTRAAVVRWLRDPNPTPSLRSMPAVTLSADEIDALSSFILASPVEPPAPPVVAPRLPLLSRSVTYAEVEREVFHRTCWHCHSEPNYARGDGGPGNTGGFGFAGVRLSFLGYETVLAGYRDPTGTPASLFRKNADGVPRLLEALLARQDEERGKPRPDVRGMPLGLPSLRPEQIQLVETWIAQGRRP